MEKLATVFHWKRVVIRIAFWATFIMWSMLLMMIVFVALLAEPIVHKSIDWSRTWFCLAVTYTFLDHFNVVAWAYCGLIFLAMVHFLQRARGKNGTVSLLVYCVPNVVLLLVLIGAITCMYAVNYAGLTATSVSDLTKLTLYYASGDTAVCGGVGSPLEFAVIAVVLNLPMWLVIATRSWRPAAKTEKTELRGSERDPADNWMGLNG